MKKCSRILYLIGLNPPAGRMEEIKMLTVYDLTIDQLNELKESYLDQHLQETEGRAASYGELADASEIVPDWLIFDAYAGTLFSPDDFSCGEEVTPA